MVRDTEEKLNRAQSDMFDDDGDDDDSRELNERTVKIVAALIIFAILVGGIALGWYLYGDAILAGIDRLSELVDMLDNPTGF